MIYLLLGEDGPAKDNKILEIKKNTINSNEALKFDFEILYAHKLSSDILKKAILSLPVVSDKRLVLIRSIQKLSPHNLDIISEFLDDQDERIVLALESASDKIKGGLIEKAKKHAKVFQFSQKKKMNVFDMTKAMSRRSSKDAMKILSDLLEDGNAPLMLMGGLIWFWGKSKIQLSTENYHKGLSLLQEADLNIKRSRLKSDYALELLVVKLISLL